MSARVLPEGRVRQAEFRRTSWFVTPERGTVLDDLFEPEYWVVAARMMKPGDRIEVFPEDGSWYAELLVRAVDGPQLRVEELFSRSFEAAPREISVPQPSVPAFERTAEGALARLRSGNARFVADPSGCAPGPQPSPLRSVENQTPIATVIGCSDSRVTPELLFGGLYGGELFVVRNAGNVPDSATIGTVEYGASVLGIPLVVVLGHERCGAVSAACDAVLGRSRASGALASIVDEIVPAVQAARRRGGDPLDEAVSLNAIGTARALVARSRLLSELAASGKIAIKAARYDLDDGRVTFLS